MVDAHPIKTPSPTRQSTQSVPSSDLVDFGHADIPRDDKQAKVDAIFSDVDGVYDVMNDVMSLGIHRHWKNILVGMLGARHDQTLVDLAGGTGDIAWRYVQAGGGAAIVCDVNPSMVAQGKTRLAPENKAQNKANKIKWVVGDATTPPLADGIAHVATIGFGLRNITDRALALASAHRLLKTGGRFYCLEFSHPHTPLVASGYSLWSRMLPLMGEVVAGNAKAYRYLVESIERFPDQETLAAMLGAAGFARVRYRNLSGGIAAIHCGWKL